MGGRALTRAERRKLEHTPAAVARTAELVYEVGLTSYGRNAQVARRTGQTDRTVRRHCRRLRQETEIHLPVARAGRPRRTDYSTSRRGHRRQRGVTRQGHRADTPAADPFAAAASSIAARGDDLGGLERLIRLVHSHWADEPGMTPREAAAAVSLYRERGGRLGPEADQYWRSVVPRQDFTGTHTPWRAAASEMRLGSWLAHRRTIERRHAAEARHDARAARASAPARFLSPAELEAKRREWVSKSRAPD